METFYLIIVIFIFLIAIFDLSVGVSNDAVNFLNSAIGAKAAPFKVIMAVAAIGIFVGASMSIGMMDIARHGIYQPQYFYMNEIMSILLAVMLTDVVLLDIFNTMGLPTSTTVSMIFALLGGTFALAIVKTINSAGALQMGDLINTDKARNRSHFRIRSHRLLLWCFGTIHRPLDFQIQLPETVKILRCAVRRIRGYLHHLFHTYQGIKRVHADDSRKPPMDSRQHTNTFRLLLPMHDNTHASTHVVSHKHFENSRLVGNFCSGISFCGK